MGKKTAIGGVVVIAFAIFVGIAIAYESTTGLNMLTGEKKTSGVGADKWTQTPETVQQQTTQPLESIKQQTTQPIIPPPQMQKMSCDSSYPGVCIPPYPPDLDCGEIQYANFKVLQPDPHGFDRDKDGIGCES